MADLLDKIAKSANCIYTSDLRYMEKARLRKIIMKVDAKAFSRKQWLDASLYLTGTAVEGADEEELKNKLCQRL